RDWSSDVCSSDLIQHDSPIESSAFVCRLRDIKMKILQATHQSRRLNWRIMLTRVAKNVFFLATLFGLIVLGILIFRVVADGIGCMYINFLTGILSTDFVKAGIMGAILCTVWLMLVVSPITMILGIGTAIYLECYANRGRLHALIETNIANLAGVPSIVYGILGMTVFSRALGLGNVVL